MKEATEDVLKSICFAGHLKSGKTTLIDALLFKAGASERFGRVDDGTSIADYEPEEKQRQMTVSTKVLQCKWKGKLLNVLDSPGYPDFFGEVVQALAGADVVVLVISAAAGIQANTRRIWELSGGMPCAIVISQIDDPNAKPLAVLDSVRSEFGRNCVPFVLPAGERIVDVLNLPDDIPSDVKETAHSLNTELVESVVESDESLMEKYLEGEKLSSEELASAVRPAMAGRGLIPIFFTSAVKDLGVEDLLDSISTFFPSYAEASKPRVSRDGEELELESVDEFVGQVFKCVIDPFVGKISYIKVLNGILTPETPFIVTRTGKKGRFGAVFKPHGKEQIQFEEAPAGDIIAVTKAEDVQISDTVCSSKGHLVVERLNFPQPVVSRACEPKSRADEQKISNALARLVDQDPTFSVTRDRQTKELIVTGMSDLHLEVLMERMKRIFDVDVSLKAPKIPYMETVTATAEGHYRHKKQTGGRGQYGEVYLRVEPLERGGGFEFENAVVGGVIPSQFIPGVEKGVREVMNNGVLAGYPITDIKVTVHDGSHHPVDSSELSFKIAGGQALKDAFLKAKPVLLEPVVTIEVTVPSRFVGDITGDLNSRRGRILGFEQVGTDQVIKAHVPLAEVTRYSSDLRSITGGEGFYTIQFSHYDIVPHKVQEQLIAQASKEKQE